MEEEAQHLMLRTHDVQQKKHQVNLLQEGGGGASAPPSASSSPSHDFSFTISLNPPTAARAHDGKAKSSPPPFSTAIDLSPADEIFFHGHLLPLHLLAHLPVSPRSSTNSLDSFTLPVKDLLHYDAGAGVDDDDDNHHHESESRHVLEGKGRGKSKSFSIFSLPKWRKGGGGDDGDEEDERQREKRKSRFQLLKSYVRFVKPFLSLGSRRRGSSREFLRPPPYSYSGNLSVRKEKNLTRGRRGEFSAPATMKTSPTNSGFLVAGSGAATPTVAKSDSTMEELQAAIQAAIAHCKKSIAAEEDKVVI